MHRRNRFLKFLIYSYFTVVIHLVCVDHDHELSFNFKDILTRLLYE